MDCSQNENEAGYHQVEPLPQSMINFDFDDDSDYASGFDSYPSSVLSNDYYYKYENGRRYFARRQVRYPFPSDDQEWSRLDMTHHIWNLATDGKLFKAPVGPEPLQILDVATGTGIWAIDVADQFPDSQVIGNDIAPVKPPWTPPNLDFHIEDIEDDWVYPENTFDLIHIRGMTGFIKDWPRLFSQCLAALKPGGYIELQEFGDLFERADGTRDDNNILQKWMRLWDMGSLRAGREFLSVPQTFETLLATVGFVDVVREVYTFPIGPWHPDKKLKEIGTCVLNHWLEGAEGITLDMFTRVLSWNKTDVDEFLVEVKRELLHPKVRITSRGLVIYARKPLVQKKQF